MWPFKKKTEYVPNENDPWFLKRKEYDCIDGGKGKYIYCVGHQFLFSNELKKMAFYHTLNNEGILIEKDFKDLIGCEYSKNNQVVGSASVTGAVVGGLLAGTTGAIIGAVAGDKKYLSLELKIFFNDFDYPVKTLSYNNKGSKTADTTKIEKEYVDLYAMCQFIINQNKMNTN